MLDEYRCDNYEEIMAKTDKVVSTKVIESPETPAPESSDATVETKAV
jgi:hypothetical protein